MKCFDCLKLAAAWHVVKEQHDVLSAQLERTQRSDENNFVRWQSVAAELKDTQDNLALANAENRNLRAWRDATEHLAC